MTRSPSAGSLSAVGGHEENAAAYGTKVKEKLLLDEMHELLEEPVEEMVSSESSKTHLFISTLLFRYACNVQFSSRNCFMLGKNNSSKIKCSIKGLEGCSSLAGINLLPDCLPGWHAAKARLKVRFRS